MFDKLRQDDTLVVWKLERLGRSLKDLDEICQKIVDEMQQKPLIYATLPKQIFFKL